MFTKTTVYFFQRHLRPAGQCDPLPHRLSQEAAEKKAPTQAQGSPGHKIRSVPIRLYIRSVLGLMTFPHACHDVIASFS
jgi:hypothetical protein